MALSGTIVFLMIGDHERDGGADADGDDDVDCWGVFSFNPYRWEVVTAVLVHSGGDGGVGVWW